MGTLYTDRLARVVPPRDAGLPGSPRAVACNASTTAIRLDNDIFQYPVANATGVPGGYGPAIVSLHAETNDLYVLFGAASSVAANSAAVSGNTQCTRIPANQDREFEVSPGVDLYLSARTANGGALTATLRYRITSFPSQGLPGSG